MVLFDRDLSEGYGMPAPLPGAANYVAGPQFLAVIKEGQQEVFLAFPQQRDEFKRFKRQLKDKKAAIAELLEANKLDEFRSLFAAKTTSRTLDQKLLGNLIDAAKDGQTLQNVRSGDGKKNTNSPRTRMRFRLEAWFHWLQVNGHDRPHFEIVAGDATSDRFSTVSVVWLQRTSENATSSSAPAARDFEPSWALLVDARFPGKLTPEVHSRLLQEFRGLEVDDPPEALGEFCATQAAPRPRKEPADGAHEFYAGGNVVIGDETSRERIEANDWHLESHPDGFSATLLMSDDHSVRKEVVRATDFALRLERTLKQSATIAVDLCAVRSLRQEFNEWVGWPEAIVRASGLARHLADAAEDQRRADVVAAKLARKFNLRKREVSELVGEALKENPARFQFLKAHGALDDEYPAHVLVTANVERIIQHWYHCESVGAIDSIAVHRVWSRVAPLVNGIDDRVDYHLASNLCAPIVVVDILPDQDGMLAALSSVPYSCPIESRCLVWHCDRNRQFDLLTPVTESLRKLLDLGEYSDAHIKSWIKGHCTDGTFGLLTDMHRYAVWLPAAPTQPVTKHARGTEKPLNISGINRLRSLLVGSTSDGDFKDIVKVLHDLLIGLKGDLRIVVANPHHADELTLRLLTMVAESARARHLEALEDPDKQLAKLSVVLCGLPRDWDIPHDTLPYDWSESSEHCDPYPGLKKLREQVPRVERLLHVASILGVAFLRLWLRTILEKTEVNRGEFRRALTELVHAGVLRYSGHLCDIGEEKRRFREISFCSSDFFEKTRDSVQAEERRAVLQVFLRELRHNVREHGVDTVRCKIRVCELLDGIEKEAFFEESDAKVLAELWCLAGSRARHAGAPQEAIRRLDKANQLVRAFGLDDKHGMRSLALRILVHRLAVSEDRIASVNDDASIEQAKTAAKECLEQARRLRERFGATNEKHEDDWLFALHRRCWNWHHRFGRLPEAMDWATSLRNRVNVAAHPDAGLQLEVYHILCVASFSMGQLRDCIEFGEEGRRICELARRGAKYDNSDMFGSHDGGVCAKNFLALSHLLRGDADIADPIRQAALSYAGTREDDTTPLVARSYARLYQLFRGDFEAAIDGELSVEVRDDIRSPWCIFDDLVVACAGVARCWTRNEKGACDDSDEKSTTELCDSLTALRREWKSQEYDSLWTTYEAVALTLVGRERDALDQFAKVANDAEQRGELFYLPELYRFWSWCLEKRNERGAADDKRRAGLEWARKLGMKLFEDRLGQPSG